MGAPYHPHDMRFPPVRIRTQLEGPLADLYGEREPFHFTGSSDDPLRGVTVYGNDVGPHWHYVGFGMADRFGFELTFRLAASDIGRAREAPQWPVRLLQDLAAHAVRTERRLGRGQYVCFEGPVDPARQLRCVALVDDPQLHRPRSNDEDYLQVVGLREEELPWISEDTYERLLAVLRKRTPLLVTQPGRDPVLP